MNKLNYPPRKNIQISVCIFGKIVVSLRAFGEWNKKGTFRKAVL